MLCITGKETCVRTLNARIDEGDRQLKRTGVKAAMHELRLDALEKIDDETFGLIEKLGRRALVCCRPTREGGAFEGEESARLELLERAHLAGARFVDIEHDVPEAKLGKFERQNIVLSRHDFRGVPPKAATMIQEMAERQVGAVKLACQVNTVEELAPLHHAARDLQRQDQAAAIIGMGAAGLVSRSHYRAFGSAWTYIAATPETATAPGQLDLKSALDMGLPRSAGAPLYGLVGGPQVFASPGPRTYCALFKAHSVPSSYVPIIANDLNAALPLLESLGARGLSVTMPLKRAALGLAQADDLARQVGAANTLWLQNDVWHATNTDVRGVHHPLATAISEVTRVSGRETRALILGTGGAARATIIACLQMGLEITVAGRNVEAAKRAAGTHGNAIAWLDRTRNRHDVLINATSLAGQQCPWPENAPVNAQIVFDLAISREPSRLLARSRSAGAFTLDPTAMWLHQGAAQVRVFLGKRIDAEELRESMPSSARLDRSEGAV